MHCAIVFLLLSIVVSAADRQQLPPAEGLGALAFRQVSGLDHGTSSDFMQRRHSRQQTTQEAREARYQAYTIVVGPAKRRLSTEGTEDLVREAASKLYSESYGLPPRFISVARDGARYANSLGVTTVSAQTWPTARDRQVFRIRFQRGDVRWSVDRKHEELPTETQMARIWQEPIYEAMGNLAFIDAVRRVAAIAPTLIWYQAVFRFHRQLTISHEPDFTSQWAWSFHGRIAGRGPFHIVLIGALRGQIIFSPGYPSEMTSIQAGT